MLILSDSLAVILASTKERPSRWGGFHQRSTSTFSPCSTSLRSRVLKRYSTWRRTSPSWTTVFHQRSFLDRQSLEFGSAAGFGAGWGHATMFTMGANETSSCQTRFGGGWAPQNWMSPRDDSARGLSHAGCAGSAQWRGTARVSRSSRTRRFHRPHRCGLDEVYTLAMGRQPRRGCKHWIGFSKVIEHVEMNIL